MATSSQLDLAAYMSNSIRTIMAKAYKSVLSNPREAKFAYRMQTHFQKSEKRRKKMLEQEGLSTAIPHQQHRGVHQDADPRHGEACGLLRLVRHHQVACAADA